MTAAIDWQSENERYLAAAMAWVRLRLGRQIEPHSANDAELDDAARAYKTAEKSESVPALMILGERLGLSAFERELLLLCVAMELDTRLPALCARAHEDAGRSYPTFALALSLFDRPAWECLSPTRPLRYWRLIEVSCIGAQPLISGALRADERIVHYVKGLNYLDERLAPLVAPLDEPDAFEGPPLPPSQQQTVARLVECLESGSDAGRMPVVQLVGPDTASKRLVARRLADRLGLTVYRLSPELLLAQAGDLESVARLWHREALLLPLALYVDAFDVDKIGSEPVTAAVTRFLSRTGGVLFVDVREAWNGMGCAAIGIEVSKPLPEEQRDAWMAGANLSIAEAGRLASQFNLSVAAIAKFSASSLEEGAAAESADHERLWRACVTGTRPRLEVLAHRLEPKAGWADIVLPQIERTMLRQIADQVRGRSRVYDEWGFRSRMNRGLGISALFAGESGTGKTMAAEVIANELELDLFRIDLAAVVSKYIGETEKNLCRLFDAAEDGGAILLFDEADALFGKRSEVKDSHDRYANIEINYLLQRMEAYRGLAILATNMKSAIDRAFMRRLRFVVGFPFPAAAERRAIWARIFPPGVPATGLDFDWLARFNLTGGSIHSIALHAAFLAAAGDRPVGMSIVLDAIRAELGKLEKPVNQAELRWPVRDAPVSENVPV